MRKNERTHKMMKQFMKLHLQGLSIAEIAAKFKLSKNTIYDNLEEIARKEGVTRESLLQKVQPTRYVPGSIHAKTPVIPEGTFRADVDAMMQSIEGIQKTMSEGLKTIEETSKQEEELR